MSVAPLSTNIRIDDPSERRRVDPFAEEAIKAPKYPEGQWLSRAGVGDEEDAEAAGAAAGAAEAPRALKENPNVVGSEGAWGAWVAAAGDGCAK